MITCTPPAGLVLTVTKPAATTLTITAATDVIGNIITKYTIVAQDANLPNSIVISADNSAIYIKGDSSSAFGRKQMDYTIKGVTGTAFSIVDIPKEADLYFFHVDSTVSQIYTFTANVYEGISLGPTNTFTPITFSIMVYNNWDSNKFDIQKILTKAY